MKTCEEIIEQYNAFSAFLQSVSVEELQAKYTPEELHELANAVNRIKIRPLPHEIKKAAGIEKQEDLV